jgi:CHAD domain-containing protein
MQAANERLELLKWVASNLGKVKRLQKAIGALADKITLEPALQDIQICSALTKLQHLEDRMEYLDKEIDSQHFVNEGKLKLKSSNK